MKLSKYALFPFCKVLYSLSFDMLAVWRQGKFGTVPKVQDEVALGSKIGAQKSPDVISGDFLTVYRSFVWADLRSFLSVLS